MSQSRNSVNEGLFTFKPKLSLTSTRIVENMGTDFMSRQQHHLEKQKKMMERAEHQRNGRLSPMGKAKKLNKSTEKEGSEGDQDVQNDSQTNPADVASEEKTSREETFPPRKEKISANLQRILEGPYASGNPEMALKKLRPPGTSQRPRVSQSRPPSDGDDSDDDRKVIRQTSQSCVEPTLLGNMRSKTMPPQLSLNRPKLGNRRSTYLTGDRLKLAKDMVDKAIRLRKVFTIQGGYSAVRNSLRRRGWIEKFYHLTVPPKKAPGMKRKRNCEEDDDDDGDDDADDGGDVTDDDDGHKPEEPKIRPWEEDDGIYGIMSRMVRNVNPSFYWVLKRDAIDYRFLGKEQMVNHYCKAGSFTTKVGLCVNMRNVPWFEQADPDVFFPRCYRLSHDDDKEAFIDDYRLTSCINIIKLVINKWKNGPCSDKEEDIKTELSEEVEDKTSPKKCENSEGAEFLEEVADGSLYEQLKTAEIKNSTDSTSEECRDPPTTSRSKGSDKKKKKRVVVPLKALENAVLECEKFLRSKDHDDIDDRESIKELSPHNWNLLIQWFYQLAHENGVIPDVTEDLIGQCESLLNRLKTSCPQLEMDGVKNVWIVKPGAKSRGRGIVCYAKLEEMLKLVDSTVVKKEGKFVVQKYIERPLLIYNTKFDIRQWFLVTDWNPLTLWFYQDCYLRFCSQEFTLDKFDEAIHLSNNTIQKNYKNGPRSTMLPQENMWSHYQFKEFLGKRCQGHLWDELVYPGMKKAITCALLATQDLVEYRKFSFELYGADFMLTEDLTPWLIEINCSPSMEASTTITTELCANVLEDTVKVVVDRRFDRNADIGRFELAYKQSPVTVPPYIGLNLSVDGQGIKRPPPCKPPEISSTALDAETLHKLAEGDKGKTGRSEEKNSGKTDEKRDSSSEENVSSKDGEKTDGSADTVMNDSGKGVVERAKDSTGTKVQNRTAAGGKDLLKRKSQSSPTKVAGASQSASKTNQSGSQTSQTSPDNSNMVRKSAGTARSDCGVREKQEQCLSQSMPSQPGTATKSLASPTSMYAITGGRRIISRTSVANNYPVINLNQGQREKQTLQVNTVDTKTIQTQHTTSAPLKGDPNCGTWAGLCVRCGGGIILKRDKRGVVVSPQKKEEKGVCSTHTSLVRVKHLKSSKHSVVEKGTSLALPSAQISKPRRVEQPQNPGRPVVYWLPQKSLLPRTSIQNQVRVSLPVPIIERVLPPESVPNSEVPPASKPPEQVVTGWVQVRSTECKSPVGQLAPDCFALRATASSHNLSPRSSRHSATSERSKTSNKPQHSPPPFRPPSAKHPSQKPWASLVTTNNQDEKILLRCTDGGIPRPASPPPVVTKSLPRFRKHIGPKTKNTAHSHTAPSVNCDSLTSAMCIVSQSTVSRSV